MEDKKTKTAKEWMEEGDKLFNAQKYEEAIVCYDKAIELDPQNDRAWSHKGKTLRYFGRSEEAIACYDKAIELNPQNDWAWSLKGDVLKRLDRNEEAIACYDKAIELNPQGDWAWESKCNVLVSLGRYKEAIKCLDYFIKLNLETEWEWANLYKQVCELLKQKKEDEKIPYKELFVRSRSMLNMLHVKDEAKQGVAHYTTPKMLSVLILKEREDKKPSRLRLHLINLSNDPSEGRTLMDYLYQKYIPVEDNGIIALSASFTFNRDCLNQFRLYGKDDKGEKEGAGISIIVKEDFFESTIKAPSSMMSPLAISKKPDSTKIEEQVVPISETNEPSEAPNRKVALFRCMYVDPETQQVISLGQREEYTFYRDGFKEGKTKEEIREEIERYRKTMNDLVEKVQTAMDDILKIVEDNKLDSKIVSELLVDLRCLTKHVAFREEQECRIVKVADCTADNNGDIKHSDDYDQLYMDYLPLVIERKSKNHYVKEVCFGPHFKYREVYAAELKKIGIDSRQSTHPLA
jgi:tetratricopeptide (TPR) repeat protein